MLHKVRRFLRKSPRDKVQALRTAVQYFAGGKKNRERLRFRALIEGPLVPPSVLRGDSRFYLAYRPDWDIVHHLHPEIPALSRQWVAGNVENNAGDMPRLYALIANIQQVFAEGVSGDLAELGVYRGNSAAILAHYARQHGRHLMLFDTFEGFDRRDLAGEDAGKPVDFGDTSLDLVKHAVGVDSVRYVKGFFPESIPSDLESSAFCIAHLDCDLYEPTKAGLEFFYPRLSGGGLLMIHDYHNRYWTGVKQAVDEFLCKIDESIISIPDKSGTVMLRKSVRRGA